MISYLIKVSFSVNASNDFCVHLNTARYVLGCSKYFEQLKTPCPYRKLDFLRSRKSFQISDAIFTLLNGLNYPLSTLLLILWVCIFVSDDWAVQDTLVQLHHLPTQEENNFGIKEQIDTITNRYNKWLYLFHISSC